jgi:hypothetical protein
VKVEHFNFCVPCELLVEGLCFVMRVLFVGDSNCFLLFSMSFSILGPCHHA